MANQEDGLGQRDPTRAARQRFRRLPVELSARLLEYLKHLGDLTEVSQAEAVRRAILFYGWAVEQSVMGRRVVAVDDGDDIQDAYGGEPGLRMAALNNRPVGEVAPLTKT